MNILKKFFIVMCVVAIIISFWANFYEVKALTLKQMEENTKNFLDKGNTGAQKVQGTEDVFKDLGSLGSVLTAVGGGVMVIATLYMGIRYMTASPDAQARLKQQLIGLVVSGIVIFGAYFIWQIVVNIVKQF